MDGLPLLASVGDDVPIPKEMLCPRVLGNNEDTISEADQEFGKNPLREGNNWDVNRKLLVTKK